MILISSYSLQIYSNYELRILLIIFIYGRAIIVKNMNIQGCVTHMKKDTLLINRCISNGDMIRPASTYNKAYMNRSPGIFHVF